MENHSFYFNVFLSFPYYKICTFEIHEQRMFSKTFHPVMKTSGLLTPLPDDKILDWSKLKQIADDILRGFKMKSAI